MSVKSWKIDTSVTTLNELSSLCLLHDQVDRMLVALRLERSGNKWRHASDEAGDRVRRLFEPYILTSFQASAWPGTELIKHPGLVFVVKFDETVKDLMVKTEPNLNKWVHHGQPSLPEDICLFKATGSHPSLVSVTHEKRAWLITNKTPELQGVSINNSPTEGLYFEGEYFCRKYNKNHQQ